MLGDQIFAEYFLSERAKCETWLGGENGLWVYYENDGEADLVEACDGVMEESGGEVGKEKRGA